MEKTLLTVIFYRIKVLFPRPKNKYIRITKDENFHLDEHYLSNMSVKAEKACSYDLDNCDIVWLKLINGERASMGK